MQHAREEQRQIGMIWPSGVRLYIYDKPSGKHILYKAVCGGDDGVPVDDKLSGKNLFYPHTVVRRVNECAQSYSDHSAQ